MLTLAIYAKPNELKKAKIKKGWTNYDLARFTSYDYGYICKVCNCWDTPSKQMASIICKELNAEFDQLFEIRETKALVTLDLDEIEEVCMALGGSELAAKFITAGEKLR